MNCCAHCMSAMVRVTRMARLTRDSPSTRCPRTRATHSASGSTGASAASSASAVRTRSGARRVVCWRRATALRVARTRASAPRPNSPPLSPPDAKSAGEVRWGGAVWWRGSSARRSRGKSPYSSHPISKSSRPSSQHIRSAAKCAYTRPTIRHTLHPARHWFHSPASHDPITSHSSTNCTALVLMIDACTSMNPPNSAIVWKKTYRMPIDSSERPCGTSCVITSGVLTKQNPAVYATNLSANISAAHSPLSSPRSATVSFQNCDQSCSCAKESLDTDFWPVAMRMARSLHCVALSLL
eukprot:3803294-Rhodomonas_salina.1